MLLQGDVLAHVTTIINTDAYKLYSIYYILYVLCLYIIDLTVQFHCYTVIEMLLQFTVIIAKVAPSIATKTGLRESLLTYGFLDYVHGYMFFLTMGLIKHFFFFFFFLRIRPNSVDLLTRMYSRVTGQKCIHSGSERAHPLIIVGARSRRKRGVQ